MGGNALKNTFTRRYLADEYHDLTRVLVEKLRTDFPNRRINVLPAYRTKESFGDMDILFESDALLVNMRDYIEQTFSPSELVKNGNGYSFDVSELQIDLILMGSANYQTSLDYYSWNDLGNFLGRVAHKLGFKFGHEGLVMIYNDDTHEYAQHVVSKDTAMILRFLGYDPGTFRMGFDTLDDIYRFASSSSYFNVDIFALENRNHTARVRDKKRATYNGFLEWMQSQTGLPAYPHETMDERGLRVSKVYFLERAFEFFPDFKAEHDRIHAEFAQWKAAKELFNGKLVGTITGLSGIDLGILMKTLKGLSGDKLAFQKRVLCAGADEIRRWVLDVHSGKQRPL